MALGRKTGGRNFEPGVTTNPKGRTPVPEYLKKARKMTKLKFEEILQKYIYCTSDELKEALLSKETTALELCVVKVLHESIRRGDQKRLEFILDRLIGKVKSELDVTSNGETLTKETDLTKLSDKDLLNLDKIMAKCQN